MESQFFLTLFLALLASFNSYADGINGYWQQIDDKENRINSLVRIETVNGRAQATIIKGYPAPGKTLDHDARCTACPGQLKDKKLIGLRFLWDLRPNGNEWVDGQILDPTEGKIYQAKAILSEDNTTLTVRGYLGIELFGRSQTWRHFKGVVSEMDNITLK
jgi:uncharacterized protein (DUF2147 family)